MDLVTSSIQVHDAGTYSCIIAREDALIVSNNVTVKVLSELTVLFAVCVCVWGGGGVRACVPACVRACLRACLRVCVCVCVCVASRITIIDEI